MALTPTTEDYLQAIDGLLTEGQTVIAARLAERLKVTPASVSQTLDRMARQDLVETGPHRQIALTPVGREAADAIVRRHRITERFLTDILQMGWVQAHEEAHRLEHAISDAVEERLTQLLGRPETCPHGAPIPGNFPPGHDADWVPIVALTVGESATITRISEAIEDDRALLEYCDAKNLRPGVEVTLTEEAPDGLAILAIGAEAVALSPTLSRQILCRRAAHAGG